jgi:hypothetical protein
MIPQNQNTSVQRFFAEDPNLRIKHERVTGRLERYAETLGDNPVFLIKSINLLAGGRSPEEAWGRLALASTIVDAIDSNPIRDFGQILHDGAIERGREIRMEAAARRAAWQARAEAIWAKNPSLSKSAVAQRIAKEISGEFKPDTIRKRIRKPAS